MTNSTVLRIANTPETHFLLQPELRAIQKGLRFGEIGDGDDIYVGYIN